MDAHILLLVVAAFAAGWLAAHITAAVHYELTIRTAERSIRRRGR